VTLAKNPRCSSFFIELLKSTKREEYRQQQVHQRGINNYKKRLTEKGSIGESEERADGEMWKSIHFDLQMFAKDREVTEAYHPEMAKVKFMLKRIQAKWRFEMHVKPDHLAAGIATEWNIRISWTARKQTFEWSFEGEETFRGDEFVGNALTCYFKEHTYLVVNY